MKIEDAMSKEIIVGYVPGTVRDALKILAKNNVSGMPVLKKDTKTVVGVVTRTDIFRNTDEDQLQDVSKKQLRHIPPLCLYHQCQNLLNFHSEEGLLL